MGHYALLLVAGLLVTSAFLMGGLRIDIADADQALNLRLVKILARDAAISGVQMTTRMLAGDQNPWIDPTDYEVTDLEYSGGIVTTTVSGVGFPPGDTVDVVSVGRRKYIARNGVGRDTSHTVQVRFVRYANPGVPLAFSNAITTDIEIELVGNIYIGSLDSTINAGIHTNGHLTTTGNSFLVEGYGTYTTTEDVRQPDNFVPNNDTNGSAPNVFQADSIRIPNLDLTELIDESTVHETGDLTIDGDTFPYLSFAEWAAAIGSPTGYGTEADPFILVVDGTLTFLNRVELEGFGIVASLTNINIVPQGIGGGLVGGLFGTYVQLGIYTPGFIDIAGNAEIVGFLYGKDYIRFQGTPDVTGGLVTNDARFAAGGNPRVLHSTIKIGNGWGIRTRIIGPRIIAYAEW